MTNMSRDFLAEGWVCLHPYKADHYVAKILKGVIDKGPHKGTPLYYWETLCSAHGWSRGPGLRPEPLDFKPTCKKCLKLSKELKIARANGDEKGFIQKWKGLDNF